MKLQIAEGLSLPLDATTEKLAFLGRTGSGKSYAASKLAELMLEAGAQVVALDVVGIWYGLRTGPEALKIPVFGGLHGDVPLEPPGGALVADLIVDRNISAVLDMSQMLDSEKARFAYDFATRFFYRKKSSPGAVHVFIEECQELVPQNFQKGEERMLHAFERLVKLGRNFGIGVSLISQRPQEVNKKALNQVECVFAFQMTGTHERKAVEAWISDKGIDIDVKALLPKLDVGCPHVWSPRWLGISKQVRILAKLTTDTSSTPKVGAKKGKAQQLTPIDLEALRAEMAATIERAKADDPKALRARIAELEKQLKQPAKVAPPPPPKVVEVPVLKEADIKRIEAMSSKVIKAAGELQSLTADVYRAIQKLSDPKPPTAPITVVRQPGAPKFGKPIVVHAPHVGTSSAAPSGLGKGERVTLIAIAQLGPVTREQLTITTGYKRSTRDAYIQRLRTAELVELRGEQIAATERGIAELGSDYEPLPTGEALREHWLRTLPEGESKVLRLILGEYPEALTRDAITVATKYARSSRDAYIQRLGARKLVSSNSSGVCASDHLFAEAT